MKVDELRERFLRFFEQRGHKIYPSDSLIPKNDPTLLFTGAGMNQFKEEFMGRVRGPKRAATCQKCLRTSDLENVGKTPSHHTFFEMLGNFSFGDYFKKEAITWAWEFLTEELKLNEKDLWVSVYKDDKEAYGIWKDVIKIPSNKILQLGEKDNFWPANAPTQGPNGPCGPCSEIFFGGPDGIEVWNLVFTQFDRQENGELKALPNKNIDTGMGLERIARVMQKKVTNFDIDIFEPIIATINSFLSESGKDISRLDKKLLSHRNAIADHIRAITFAMGDGILPSNEERGYVIRKLIRKAFWYGRTMAIYEPFLYKIAPVVAKVMSGHYPELVQQREDISAVILSEEKRFKNTLDEGLERLRQMLDSSRPGSILKGIDVFKLYDTYGFPLELTKEIAEAENIKIDIDGFEKCMENQRSTSKATSKIKAHIFDIKGPSHLLPPQSTEFIEDKEEVESKIVQIIVNNEEKNELKQGETGKVFLDRTNFYGEKGGQIGDKGVLIKEGYVLAEVLDAVDIAGRVQHDVRVKKGLLKKEDSVIAKVDMERRKYLMKNHTATHLLHNALRRVLGAHVKQAGSLVAPDRLRFDFTHFKALTEEEISRIEELVNKNIRDNSIVDVKVLPIEEAKRSGAIALFGEKYGDSVRMVSIGDYSKELCGGTHLSSTKEIELFKIISESSIASGTRRLEAITGKLAFQKINESEALIKELAIELNTTPDKIVNEIEKQNKKLKDLEKEFGILSKNFIQLSIEDALKNIEFINGYEIIISELKSMDMPLLRDAADILRGRLKKGIFVLLSKKDEKLSMVVGLTPSIKDKKIDAVKLLDEIGLHCGIKGGGKPDFSQAGSHAECDIKDIIKKTKTVIKNATG